MKRTIAYKNGETLSYAEYGAENGYPFLFQHGLIASIEDEALFARLLKSGVRLICMARPGYGESSPYLMNNFAEWAEIVAPLVQDLGLEQFDVFGMSSGAPYSYALGYGFSEKVRNIYIFSGTPALYDEVVLAHWPYGTLKGKSMAELEKLAHEWFFSNLTEADLEDRAIKASMSHQGFGVAQDLRLRFVDWGFELSTVQAKVFMRHSRCDDSVPFETAIRTAELLPDCHLELLEAGPHFSVEALDDFIEKTILKNL